MRLRTGLALVAAAVVLADAPALAQSANGFRTGAFYRALLRSPAKPAYWAGGTVWVPLAPILSPPRAAAAPVTPVPPKPAPVTKRVPDAYLAAARSDAPNGPAWVKTVRGFRLETTGASP